MQTIVITGNDSIANPRKRPSYVPDGREISFLGEA